MLNEDKLIVKIRILFIFVMMMVIIIGSLIFSSFTLYIIALGYNGNMYIPNKVLFGLIFFSIFFVMSSLYSVITFFRLRTYGETVLIIDETGFSNKYVLADEIEVHVPWDNIKSIEIIHKNNLKQRKTYKYYRNINISYIKIHFVRGISEPIYMPYFIGDIYKQNARLSNLSIEEFEKLLKKRFGTQLEKYDIFINKKRYEDEK